MADTKNDHSPHFEATLTNSKVLSLYSDKSRVDLGSWTCYERDSFLPPLNMTCTYGLRVDS